MLSIVPPMFVSTLQTTAVSGVPVTVAAKSCLPPGDKVTVLGVTVILMSGGGDRVGADGEVELPPHPQTPISATITSAMARQ